MYSIVIEQRASKTLKKISQKIRLKINQTITSLKFNPRPFGSKKLKNSNYYRIRIGDYRVIYSIVEKEIKIFVIYIGHRKDVYRYLK